MAAIPSPIDETVAGMNGRGTLSKSRKNAPPAQGGEVLSQLRSFLQKEHAAIIDLYQEDDDMEMDTLPPALAPTHSINKDANVRTARHSRLPKSRPSIADLKEQLASMFSPPPEITPWSNSPKQIAVGGFGAVSTYVRELDADADRSRSPTPPYFMDGVEGRPGTFHVPSTSTEPVVSLGGSSREASSMAAVTDGAKIANVPVAIPGLTNLSSLAAGPRFLPEAQSTAISTTGLAGDVHTPQLSDPASFNLPSDDYLGQLNNLAQVLQLTLEWTLTQNRSGQWTASLRIEDFDPTALQRRSIYDTTTFVTNPSSGSTKKSAKLAAAKAAVEFLRSPVGRSALGPMKQFKINQCKILNNANGVPVVRNAAIPPPPASTVTNIPQGPQSQDWITLLNLRAQAHGVRLPDYASIPYSPNDFKCTVLVVLEQSEGGSDAKVFRAHGETCRTKKLAKASAAMKALDMWDEHEREKGRGKSTVSLQAAEGGRCSKRLAIANEEHAQNNASTTATSNALVLQPSASQQHVPRDPNRDESITKGHAPGDAQLVPSRRDSAARDTSCADRLRAILDRDVVDSGSLQEACKVMGIRGPKFHWDLEQEGRFTGSVSFGVSAALPMELRGRVGVTEGLRMGNRVRNRDAHRTVASAALLELWEFVEARM
ncbi:hypothetical protein CAC42_948 [Sphaceloma murrayae]|uniref:DRBM domain-containing protein n=1 Tax=Sphaceloma murrayae TaxID=2082308 RepID=A0A2K1R2U2_9PEZI|nr:hypothetical protein CAC42_948 [Sphaceloma murrayae]